MGPHRSPALGYVVEGEARTYFAGDTGLFDEISVVIRSTLQQIITPDRLRGRVSAVNYVFIGFSNELGAFESGTAASLIGPVLATAGGGVVSILVAGVVMLAWPQLVRVGPLHTLTPFEVDPESRSAQALGQTAPTP